MYFENYYANRVPKIIRQMEKMGFIRDITSLINSIGATTFAFLFKNA